MNAALRGEIVVRGAGWGSGRAHVDGSHDTTEGGRSVPHMQVWRRPADGRCSVHVRVRYGSETLPLGAAQVARLHEQLRAAVPTLLGMPLRTRQDALSVQTP